jgi:hypothetical protein
MSYDNSYNKRLQERVREMEDNQYDLLQRQPTNMLGGGRVREYITHGSSTADSLNGMFVGGMMRTEVKERLGKKIVAHRMEGGKVNRKKKADKWLGFATDVADKALGYSQQLGGKVNRKKKADKWLGFATDVADKALGYSQQLGGKVNRYKKAEKWLGFSGKVADKALGYSQQMGGAKPASPWIAHVKAYAQEHGCSYKEAMTRAKDSYRR